MHHSSRRFALLLIATTAAGCGSSEQTVVPVSGTVEYNGAPVVGASVTFIAVEGSEAAGRSANGITDSAGKFTLTTYEDGDGAIPGDYKVTVVSLAPPKVDEFGENMDPNVVMEPMEDDPYAVEDATEIPLIYADPETTTVTATVGAAGDTDLKLEL